MAKSRYSQKAAVTPVHVVKESIPAFHSLTASDTTSYIAGCSKKSAWKTFQEHHQLLKNLGKGELTLETSKNAELFICKLYIVQNVSITDEARAILFNRSCSPESLPPTSDALHFHIQRTIIRQLYGDKLIWPIQNYQILEAMGWKVEDGNITPILMSLTPVLESCRQIITSNCKCSCKTLHCRGCKCRLSEHICHNE